MSTIAIVCEAPADRATVVAILECVLSTTVDWYEPGSGFATFRGYLPTDSQLLWRDTKHLAKQQRISVQGFMRGGPASPDAHNAKRALLLFARRMLDHNDPIDAVIMLRDSDRDNTRHVGLTQARDEADWPFSVIIGVAHTERECWHICGFEPDADELPSIEALRQELGFDPRLHSHDLTAKHDHDKLSAKRVLSILTNDRYEREMACIPISIGVSEERGNQNGLANFLTEVRERLVLSLFAVRK